MFYKLKNPCYPIQKGTYMQLPQIKDRVQSEIGTLRARIQLQTQHFHLQQVLENKEQEQKIMLDFI